MVGWSTLCAVIGSSDFKFKYVTKKIEEWCKKVNKLSEFAKAKPHAALSAYIHGQQTQVQQVLTKPSGT